MPTTDRTTVGFIGVGAIASAMAEALLTGPAGDTVEVVVSPRSAGRSAALAERHPRVRIAADNQAVADAADVVVLSVLPDQLPAVCAALSLRAEQTVVGLVAGWPPSRLAAHVAPARTVCQLIPLPMIALHTGPVVLCPPTPDLERLLEGCGEIITVEREEDLGVLACASATMSTFLAFEQAVVDWSVRQGIEPVTATRYATALYGGLAVETAHTDPADLDQVPQEHETPGGLNQYLRESLTSAGLFTELQRHLDQLRATWFR